MLARSLLLAIQQLSDPAILKVLAKSLAVTLAIFAALGLALWFWLGPIISGWGDALGDDDYTGIMAALATAIIVFAGGWLLFRVVALAAIQFFADEIVRAVERKHYGHLAKVPSLPFATELRHSIRSTLRAIGVNLLVAPIALFLVFTGIGTALVFWLANAFLLGRELQDMVWLRHREQGHAIAPIGGITRFALGGVIAALLAVPGLNLLAPIIGAASATHLIHQRKHTHAPI